MNFKIPELFEIQRKLDAEIEEKHSTEKHSRIEDKFLALYTEIAECANEWRGFKFWSKYPFPDPARESYPLLEEYVDGIHFLLSLGLEFGFENIDFQLEAKEYAEVGTTFKEQTITKQFNSIYYTAAQFESDHQEEDFIELVLLYLALGEMLGFTWEQIEAAYYEKNQVNHERQAKGY